MRSQHALQVDDRDPQIASGHTHAPHGLSEFSPGIHVPRLELHMGWWYAICSCSSRSMPSVYAIDLKDWRCPWVVAAEEIAACDRLWLRRLADAQLTR